MDTRDSSRAPSIATSPAPPHPLIYLTLILPFGVSTGFVTVTLAYRLAHAGVDAAQVAFVVALDLFPQTWKFLWAPIADTTLTRKTWYRTGAVLTAVGIVACGLVPAGSASLPVLSALVLMMSLATTFVAMSTEALIAHHTPDGVKGRASGWFQAGNLGGQGVGGGAGLWMAGHLSASWISPAVLGLACVLCSLALLWIREPARAFPAGSVAGRARHRLPPALIRQWSNLLTVLKGLWLLVTSRRGFLALLVVFLPITTGAASNLWAAVSGGWHASADTVALINGALGGTACALGCLGGGFVCDRLDRKTAYLLYGAAQALCVVAMAVAPHTERMFAAFTLLYAVLNGMGYAAFSAVVLETIGASAAATRYNVYASLSNMPILYMGLAEGWTYTRFGASAMLYLEAALAVAAMLVFASASALTSRRKVALAT
jgi:MFS transporter, PAT family, beta-lactamase induction signal transducer AmpG